MPSARTSDGVGIAYEAVGKLGNEPPGEIVLPTRVGRRQEDDLHCGAGADGRTLFQSRMNPPGRHVAIETA